MGLPARVRAALDETLEVAGRSAALLLEVGRVYALGELWEERFVPC